MKVIDRIIKLMISTIILFIIFTQNSLSFGLHAPFNNDIYKDKNYGIPQDIMSAEKWTDLSVVRYGQSKATKQSNEDALQDYLNGTATNKLSAKELSNAQKTSSEKAQKNYEVAIDTELTKMNALLRKVTDAEIEAMDTTTFNNYLKAYNLLVSNSGWSKIEGSGEQSVTSLDVEKNLNNIKKKFASKIEEEEKEIINDTEIKINEGIDKDQTKLEEDAINDEKETTISEEIEHKQNTYKFEDPLDNLGNWNPLEDGWKEDELMEKAGKVIGLINVIGVVISVIALVIIGLKYMLGSVEQKAEYKKELLPYVIGVILLAGGTTLPNIIFNITRGIFH